MHSGVKKTWNPKRYEAGDETRYLAFMQRMLKKEMNRRIWEWEYECNPAGSPIIWLAESGERIVGHYALLPIRMKLGDETIKGTIAIEAMTDPDFQRQGIFTTLGRHLLGTATDEGIPITIGFPNQAALPGHRKLQWLEVFSIPMLARFLNVRPLARRKAGPLGDVLGLVANAGLAMLRLLARSPRPMEGLAVRPVTAFDDRTDVLWSGVRDSIQIAIIRDYKYLRWRYGGESGKSYQIFIAEHGEELVGYIVVREMELMGMQVGCIVDLLARPEDSQAISRHLIDAGARWLAGRGVDAVLCIMLPHTSYHGALRASGFWPIPAWLSGKAWPFIVHVNQNRVDVPMLEDPRNWYLTWGDTDVV